jgi:uncharacterized repeat protein (TIGR03837 family)
MRADIFCRVVDNFGDAGLCWRLARQLSAEAGWSVRLLIDEPAVLAALEPRYRPGGEPVEGIRIGSWAHATDNPDPAPVVIEAFGCGLPAAYIQAMAAAAHAPVWIVLEYLSAEPWVGAFHGRASPHPQLGLKRHFVFPGFDADTGGLLRERGLLARRDAFGAAQAALFWRELGFAPPADAARVICVFAYPGAPLPELVDALAGDGQPSVIVLPEGPLAAGLFASEGTTRTRLRREGERILRGAALEVRRIPFVPQTRFDELLWSCSLNCVRGEDSFVRAQWAGRPFLWHIYPQEDGAHWAKLDAFLARYCAGLEEAPATAVRDLWHAWNRAPAAPALCEAWRAFTCWKARLERHAGQWAQDLGRQPELGAYLVRLCADQVK